VSEERIRKVERLPPLEERVRSVRPMEESDLMDGELEAPAVAANSSDETVPYGPVVHPKGGMAAPSAEAQRPDGDATASYSARPPNAKYRGLSI